MSVPGDTGPAEAKPLEVQVRRLRAVWRLACTVGHAVHGLLIVLALFPHLDRATRLQRIRWWAGKLLRQLGLVLQVEGTWRPGAKLVVANHISWLDIMAIHATCPEARFVSKADVQRWPLIGRLVDSAGTLYLQREQRRDALRVVHRMAEALRAGETVAVFPEGTTGDGNRLLPFHANLLQAAIATDTPVQPVALRYADATHANSPAARWLGETTLVQSLWQLACGQGLTLHLTILGAQACGHADRRSLAMHLRECIAQTLEPVLGADPR
jgi:1-acyl-sn-glycerol-3-phosphate acyltransferase